MAYDLLIKNGLIVDGSGMPAFRGDVAIVDGPALRFGAGMLASLLSKILGATLQPGADLSISFANRDAVPSASVSRHEVKEQRPMILNLVWIA